MQITHDLAIGGLQQVVVNICRTINRDKFDISVLCLRDLGEFVPEIEKMGIKVFYLPQKNRTGGIGSQRTLSKYFCPALIQPVPPHLRMFTNEDVNLCAPLFHRLFSLFPQATASF